MIVYKYGMTGGPQTNEELVRNQLHLGRFYYNDRIAIDRERRRRLLDAQSTYSPEIENLMAWRSVIMEAIETAEVRLKAARARARRRTVLESEDLRGQIQWLYANLREVRGLLTDARRALTKNAAYRAVEAEIQEWARAEKKVASNASEAWWGTRGAFDKDADGAIHAVSDLEKAPRFRGADDCMQIAVQIQKGMTPARLFACVDTRARMQVLDARTARLDLRVASDGRRPVWASWTLYYHRPLPEKCLIKWVTVQRTTVGPHARWTALFSVCPDADYVRDSDLPRGRGAVAYDLGWRKMKEVVDSGDLRLGVIEGTDELIEDLRLDPSIRADLLVCEEIESRRDEELDQLKEWLVPWVQAHLRSFEDVAFNYGPQPRRYGPPPQPRPASFRSLLRSIGKWKAARRFSRMIRLWRDHRFKGDDEAFERAEAWRKHDKHLWCWQANLRDKALARRRDGYLKLATRLARRYHTLVLEGQWSYKRNKDTGKKERQPYGVPLDLRPFGRSPRVEDDGDGPARRKQLKVVAPGDLRTHLMNAFKLRGGCVVLVDARDTTRTCQTCGTIEVWDQEHELTHTCSACEDTWDQDQNACSVMLDRYHRNAIIPPAPPKPPRFHRKSSASGLNACAGASHLQQRKREQDGKGAAAKAERKGKTRNGKGKRQGARKAHPMPAETPEIQC
jgi:hypothetical protein